MNALFRTKTYSLEDVFKHVGPKKIDFDGDIMNMNSSRYLLFKNKGTKCVNCGIEGVFFAKECHIDNYYTALETDKNPPFHFNLYALNDKGEEVLMTKDHIIPKARGGKNSHKNYQTMCEKCNIDKGSGYPQ